MLNLYKKAGKLLLPLGAIGVCIMPMPYVFQEFDVAINTMMGLFTISMVALTTAITVRNKDAQDAQDIKASHQAIGGKVPSRALDKVIHDEYIKRCGHNINHNFPYDPLKYTTKREHTELLLRLISEDEYKLRHNIAEQSYSCTYEYEGTAYEAKSASREMAICIAFLKSCDHPDVRE